MIVRRRAASQLLITQPDHAALAARIMRQWRADGLPDDPARTSILLAVAEHDNGWREVDSAPIVDDRESRILDFVNTPDPIKMEVWPRGVERLAATPHAAALVAQHALHIYRRHRGAAPWTGFFSAIETARDRCLHEAGLTLERIQREYFFVRIGDLASLAFCNGWTDVQHDDSGSGYAIRLVGTRLTVTPDPFEGCEVPVEISARELPNRPFRSAAEAEEAFVTARTVLVEGFVSGG
jgi:hypothetical protein